MGQETGSLECKVLRGNINKTWEGQESKMRIFVSPRERTLPSGELWGSVARTRKRILGVLEGTSPREGRTEEEGRISLGAGSWHQLRE